jgi:hypothetical protein
VNTDHRARAQEQKAALSLPHDLIHAQARGHLNYYIEPARREVLGLYCNGPFDDDAVLARLKVFLTAHPMGEVTKWLAALHEAGHFVAYERLGFLAGTAEIRGSRFGRGGWGGGACRWSPPIYDGRLAPDDFLRDARGALAGPIAEELLGGGDALHIIGELIDASIRSDRAAELWGRDSIEMWDETLLGAVALVEHHEPEILDIAALLECRGRISRLDRPVEKILARVTPGPIDRGAVSQRGLALARRVTEALREFAL